VLWSAAALVVTGLFLIARMPLTLSLRSLLGLLWSFGSYLELRPFWRAYRLFSRIRVLANGDVRLCNRRLEWVPGCLQRGSVLLWRLGWLRVKTHDGHRFAELVTMVGQPQREWRRLQLIWRHIGGLD
jgi:hypothetical protein